MRGGELEPAREKTTLPRNLADGGTGAPGQALEH